MAHSTPLLTGVIEQWIREDLERMEEESKRLEALFGPYVPPTYSRRQRLGFKLHGWRERLALLIAPWLDRGEW